MINDPSQESLVGCADHAEAGLTEDKSHDPREFDLGKQITTNESKAENAGLQVSTSFNDKCTSEPRFEGLDSQIEGLDQQIEASESQLNASESTSEFSKSTINAFQRQTEALNTKFESFTFTNDREVKALASQHEALALKLEAIEVENERNKALAEENKNGIKALEQRSDALEQNYEAYQLFDSDDGEQRTRPKPLDNSNLEEQSTPEKDWLIKEGFIKATQGNDWEAFRIKQKRLFGCLLHISVIRLFENYFEALKLNFSSDIFLNPIIGAFGNYGADLKDPSKLCTRPHFNNGANFVQR
ncbi:uncharacterized protein CXQ87_004432 [Candidozyma duobushaemuli]|uniref:Uncharacterized protein n=1 Tax=Candidozyma duobushaemuli TaxID=1231522 RepID=A0A2V1AGN2_9ASCO|nr:uncharacterized protein CXQ87_004432 [[Candida] duobushaemulonis]PVH16875.1 hypothetical protein CXQ87_004432 [[Candida] duobushaemulonis]